jgi:2-(3-amino-3-carboxypropyl)histidine synthase
MKVLYIKAKQKNLKANLNSSEIVKLPKKIFLAYSLQYKDLASKIKQQLIDNKREVVRFQQVLGCSKINTKLPVLLISTGRFHAISLFLKTPSLYVLENNKIIQIPQKEINKTRARRRSALMKFLAAERIGILVSTKPGQENIKSALNLKNKLLKKNKQAFIFLSDNINIREFENFPIDSWVNTACPELTIDDPNIINLDEVLGV